MPAQDPRNLRELGERLDDAQRKRAAQVKREPPTQTGIAFRFATELVAALLVGGALGWGIDWAFGYFGIHTKPVFLILFFLLGAAAGIRGVMRAAGELNAEIARNMPANPVKVDDDEE